MNEEEKITVAVSGYFDPLHVGHLEMMKQAKALGDKLIVIVNTKEQAIRKKGHEFMPYGERKKIVEALSCVDQVADCIDLDRTVCKTLEHLRPHIFAQGGDRNFGEVPETTVCKLYDIKMVDGLGLKIQSSSELAQKSKESNATS